VRQLAIGKHVLVDEAAAAVAGFAVEGVAGGDAVVQRPAAGLEQVVHAAKVRHQVFQFNG
jgi:hypothetical protein